MNVFTERLRLAADAIEEHGWTQGVERDDATGAMCLTGAIRFCAPQNGDEHLIRQVLLRRDRAEAWNDSEYTSELDVLGLLRSAEITDADLADTFGPNWRRIVTLVRRAAALTLDHIARLAAAWEAAWEAARDVGWYAAGDAVRNAVTVWYAAGDAARNAAWDAAWDAAWYAAGDAVRNAAWDAARDATLDAGTAWYDARYAAWEAARALVVADLGGQYGLEQHHIDTLLAPWVSVMGEIEECAL